MSLENWTINGGIFHGIIYQTLLEPKKRCLCFDQVAEKTSVISYSREVEVITLFSNPATSGWNSDR